MFGLASFESARVVVLSGFGGEVACAGISEFRARRIRLDQNNRGGRVEVDSRGRARDEGRVEMRLTDRRKTVRHSDRRPTLQASAQAPSYLSLPHVLDRAHAAGRGRSLRCAGALEVRIVVRAKQTK